MHISIKKTHYTQLEIMFFFLWTFYSVYYFLFSASELSYEYYSLVNYINRICNYTLLVLLFVFWLLSFYRGVKWSIGLLLRYIGFLFVVFLIELNIRDTTLMILVLFVMAAQFIDFDKLLRYDIKLKLVLLLVIFGMCALGIVENRVGDYYSGYKQAFGFSHANALACYVLTILVEWLCIRYKKMRWYDWSGIILAFIVLSLVTNSRSSIYTFVVIFILFILANLISKLFFSKMVKLAFVVITPAIGIFSFWAVKLYAEGNSIISALNTWLSGRIRLAYYAVTVKGIKLFGQEIRFSNRIVKVNNTTVFLVDNAYIHMALRWGLVILVLIVVAYSFLFIKLLKMKRVDLALMALFFVILGFGETYMNNVLYNISLLCLLSVSDTLKQSGELKYG